MIEMLFIDGTYSREEKRSKNFLRLFLMLLFKTKEFYSLYHRPQSIMINTHQIKTMNVYRELDPMVEHRTQFAFKGKREHIANVNMPNIAYPNQH